MSIRAGFNASDVVCMPAAPAHRGERQYPTGNDRGEPDGELGPPVRAGLAGHGERPRTAHDYVHLLGDDGVRGIVPVVVSVTRPVRVSLIDVETCPKRPRARSTFLVKARVGAPRACR